MPLNQLIGFQLIVYWLMVCGNRVNKLADKNLYLTKGLMQIKTNIFIQDISNYLSVHQSQKVNRTVYILYL